VPSRPYRDGRLTSRQEICSAEELAAELPRGDPGLRVVDLRQESNDGAPRIPGSAWTNLHDGFAQARPERHLEYDLPRPGEFAAALSRLGIGSQTRIVLADDMGNRWSTRVYWLLQYYGHQGEVRVLDGGVAAWARSGHQRAQEFDLPEPAPYPPPSRTDESIRATAAQVLGGADGAELTVCDVRTPEEYRGEDVRSARGGHIPGAINVPWDQCLAADGTFLPNHQLADVLAPYLDAPGQPVTYCQGGVRGSLVWFALHVLLGRPARLYAASWEEWAQDLNLPVAV
jgi:thiosulfate/3-mercaptopyruvate sulfurtransferase